MMRAAKHFITAIFLAALCGAASAQGVIQPPNLFWATPLSGTGFLNLRPIGGADLAGLSLSFNSFSGTLSCAQLPALTGDITTTVGTCNTVRPVPLAILSGGTGTTTFTANLPILGSGASSPLVQGTVTGSTTKFVTSIGALVTGHCVQIDASGNFVDSGAVCGSGGSGSGTVTAGTINQLAFYAANGTAVSGLATANNGVLATGGGGVPAIVSTLPCLNHPALTGDVTTPANSCATTFSTVNANTGAWGSSTAIPVITLNAKGLATAASTAVVIAPAGTLTGATLAASVTASSLAGVGTLTSGATGPGFTLAVGTSTLTGNVPVTHGGTGVGTFTSNLPLIGAGAANIAQGTVSGNTTKFATVSGATPSGDLAIFDASGNIADGGATCPATGDVSAAANPTAGNVGEVLRFTASSVPVTTATSATLTSGSITAGHWLCYASINTNSGASTVMTDTAISISATTNVSNIANEQEISSASRTAYGQSMTTRPVRFDFTSPTPLFAVAYVEYTGTAPTFNGELLCERIW